MTDTTKKILEAIQNRNGPMVSCEQFHQDSFDRLVKVLEKAIEQRNQYVFEEFGMSHEEMMRVQEIDNEQLLSLARGDS